MSEEQKEMVVEPAKKVAFANRKYTNEERIKKEEEELAKLMEEQKGLPQEEEQQEAEPEAPEEKTFKKRYGDLRRHMQEKENEFQDRIKALEDQLAKATREEIKLPKSDEDLESWVKEYPDVAAIVETIAIKKAKEQSSQLEERMKAVDEMQYNAKKEKAEAELMRLHPDFGDIRDSDEFHEWAEEQPKWIQDALYENDNDARSAARAIDLYKADRGIDTKKKSSSKDAASNVNVRSKNRPQSDESNSLFKESDVQRMSAVEYEQNSDAIMEAIRSGKFVYDISGSAR